MESTLLDEDDILTAIDRVAQKFHWGAPTQTAADFTTNDLIYEGLWCRFRFDLADLEGQAAIDKIRELLEAQSVDPEDLALEALKQRGIDIYSTQLDYNEGIAKSDLNILRHWARAKTESSELNQRVYRHRR